MQPDRDFARLLADAGASARSASDRDATADRDFAGSLRDRLGGQEDDAEPERSVGASG